MEVPVEQFNKYFRGTMWCPCLIHSRIGHKLIAKLDPKRKNSFFLHMASCPEVSKK